MGWNKKVFDYEIEHITVKQFEKRLVKLFEDITGLTLNADGTVYIEEYNHGGMSSWHIDIMTWREKLILFLILNFKKVKAGIYDE